MAHALTLSASSTGRAPVPTGEGPTLLVDDANAVMIVVSPDPSSWVPENVTLHRGGAQVGTPPMSDGTTWVLMGDDRFGTFRARATAAGAVVESESVRVVPATVSLRPTPAPTPAPVAAPVAPGPGGGGPGCPGPGGGGPDLDAHLRGSPRFRRRGSSTLTPAPADRACPGIDARRAPSPRSRHRGGRPWPADIRPHERSQRTTPRNRCGPHPPRRSPVDAARTCAHRCPRVR